MIDFDYFVLIMIVACNRYLYAERPYSLEEISLRGESSSSVDRQACAPSHSDAVKGSLSRQGNDVLDFQNLFGIALGSSVDHGQPHFLQSTKPRGV